MMRNLGNTMKIRRRTREKRRKRAISLEISMELWRPVRCAEPPSRRTPWLQRKALGARMAPPLALALGVGHGSRTTRKAWNQELRRHKDVDYLNEKLKIESLGAKGLGVVAGAPLARGELLLEEAPLLVFQQQSFDVLFGDLQDVLVEEKLFEKWERSLSEAVASRCGAEAREAFWALADSCAAGEKTALGLARTNGVGLTEDSAGLFLLLSRFNHSCRPNVHHSWQEDRQVQVLTAARDIEASEELCISYLSLLGLCAPRRERLGELSDRFGFDCLCGACARGGGASDWRRERLAQLCAAFARDEAPEAEGDTIWLELQKRMPLFFEVDADTAHQIAKDTRALLFIWEV